MIRAREKLRPRVQRPQAREALGNFRGFIEHLELVVFRGQKIQARIVAGVGRNLFLQDLDVPVVLAPPCLPVRGEIVVDADFGLAQAPASGQDGGVDGLVNPAAVTIVRPVGKQANHVIHGGARPIRCVIVPLQKISRVFVESHQVFDHARTGRVQALIRIEHQDPASARLRHSMIAGGREIHPGEIERDHACPVAGRDLQCPVGRPGIDHNHFAGQVSHRIQTPSQVALFVLHDRAEAERGRHS